MSTVRWDQTTQLASVITQKVIPTAVALCLCLGCGTIKVERSVIRY